MKSRVQPSQLYNRLDDAARVMVLVAGFAIPLSTALTSFALGLAALSWVLGGNYQTKWQEIVTNPVAQLALALFGLFLLGLTYTSASWEEILEILRKYSKLFVIALIIPLFHDARWRDRAINAFLAAMLITLAASYGELAGLWDYPTHRGEIGVVIKGRITQNLFMAFTAFVLAHACVQTQNRRLRWVYGILLGLVLYNILFVVTGRTGYLALAGLVLLFFYQLFHRRGLVLGLLAIFTLGMVAMGFSGALQKRVQQTTYDVQHYERGDPMGDAVRIDFYRNSLALIARHPVMGAGTGSFGREYARLANKIKNPLTDNPHNEYLMIGVQLGVAGMALFVFLLYQQWRLAGLLLDEARYIAEGLILAFALGCLFNSFLLDFTEGWFYAYFSGVLYAGLRPENSKGWKLWPMEYIRLRLGRGITGWLAR